MDGHGGSAVGLANVANGLGGGVHGPAFAVGVLGEVGDLVVGVGFILDIHEGNHIVGMNLNGLTINGYFNPLGRIRTSHNQSLLVGVGHHAGHGNEGFGNNCFAVSSFDLLGCNRGAVLIYIANNVGNSIFLNILEGEGVLGLVVNVDGQGVALDHGEVAFLISGVEIGAALGLEGLGDTSQTGAGGGSRNLGVSALNLVVDVILLQNIGAPLAVDLQVLVDGHIGEVNGLLRIAVHVEPADEGVAAIGGDCGNSLHLGAMKNGQVGMGVADLFTGSHGVLGQVELNGVAHRYPLGIQTQRNFAILIIGACGHCVRCEVKLLASAFRIQIPSLELNRTRLVDVRRQRTVRLKVIAAQILLVRNVFFSMNQIGRIIILDIISITGVVKVHRFAYIAENIAGRIVAFGKTNDFVEFLRLRQAARVRQIDGLIEVIIFAIMLVSTRPVQRFNIVIQGCGIICVVSGEGDIFAGHCINGKNIRTSSKCLASARDFPFSTLVFSTIGANNRESGMNIRAPLFCNGSDGLVICLEGQRELGPVEVDVHNGGAVSRHGDFVRADIGPKVSIHAAGVGLQIATVIVGVLGLVAGQRIAIREDVGVLSLATFDAVRTVSVLGFATGGGRNLPVCQIARVSIPCSIDVDRFTTC